MTLIKVGKAPVHQIIGFTAHPIRSRTRNRNVKLVSGGKFYKELRLSEKCLSQPLKGLAGAEILEVVEDHLGDTYRAVYTVKLANGEDIYTLFSKETN